MQFIFFRHRRIVLTLGLFCFLFYLPRIPFIYSNWDWQDGNGAYSAIFLGKSPPDGAFEGRIHGKELFAVKSLGHPAPPFYIFSFLGKIFRPLTELSFANRNFNIGFKIAVIKFAGSLLSLTFFIGLLVTLAEAFGLAYGFIWTLLIALSPIALYGSREFQQDSTTGLLFCGAYCLGLFCYEKNVFSSRVNNFILCLGGFLVGLGKNEYSIALVIALVATLLSFWVFHCLTEQKSRACFFSRVTRLLKYSVFSLLLGNLASFSIDPSNYIGGWGLVVRMSGKNTFNGGGLHTWLNYVHPLMVFTLIPLILLLSCSLLLLVHWKRERNYSALLALIFSGILFGGYFFNSGISPASRFFSPALGCLAVLLPLNINGQMLRAPVTRVAMLVAAVFLLAHEAIYVTNYVKNYEGNRLDDFLFESIVERAIVYKNCLPVINCSYALFTDADFAHAELGPETIISYSEMEGKPICERR